MTLTRQIKVEYKGAGEFYRGIPARDLTPEEWEAFDEEIQNLIEESHIYKVLKKVKTVKIEVEPEEDENPESTDPIDEATDNQESTDPSDEVINNSDGDGSGGE